MRPIYGASPLLAVALLLCTPGLVHAEPPAPSSLAALIADVAEANQKLQDLGASVQSEQEGVNKAILDVQTARDNVAAAQRDLDRSRLGVRDAEAAIAAAQRKFDDSPSPPTSTVRRSPTSPPPIRARSSPMRPPNTRWR